MSRVLVVDDEQSMRNMLAIALQYEGYEVVTAENGDAARAEIEARSVDLIVSDIRMPGMDGIELLRFARAHSPGTEVILVTAHASTDSAVDALRLGAYDYVTKPFDIDELKLTVRRALEVKELRKENVGLKLELTDRHRLDDLVGKSEAMARVFEVIKRVTDSDFTVLITGGSGTGKELVARAIHNGGRRKDKPFVTINCAAVPSQLLESELFGHKRGSFTGADRDKDGLFVAAEGGTLLLDEIGEMPIEMQPKILRALEDSRVRPVGATTETAVDVRLLAATNRDLQTAVDDGRFREDLFYRLNVIEIDLPPLKDRPDDVFLLAEYFLYQFREEADHEISSFSEEAKALLEAYDWPGNVRELENAVRRAVTFEQGTSIHPDSLPNQVRAGARGKGEDAPASGPAELPSDGFDLEEHLDEIKRSYMTIAMEQAEGVQKKAAKLLGMSFRSFRYYLDRLDLRGAPKDE
jgi:two-component system response regulator PilR (NtrC family)